MVKVKIGFTPQTRPEVPKALSMEGQNSQGLLVGKGPKAIQFTIERAKC